MNLAPVDYVILILCFAFVIGIGWKLRKSITSSVEFLRRGIRCRSGSQVWPSLPRTSADAVLLRQPRVTVPEYLKLRFDRETRGLNAITFAVMTLFSSGISMYALAKMFNLVLGWNFNSSILLSAAIVLAYTYLGGLTARFTTKFFSFC